MDGANNLILVTGATGFVGRHTVSALLRAGHSLRLCIRSEAACPRDWRKDPRIELYRLDDLATGDLRPVVAGIGSVVHLAGLAAGPSDADALFTRANVTTTERLASAAQEARVPVFIHMSSIMAVTSNSLAAIVDDETPARPATAYGRSKLEAERVLRRIGRPDSFTVSLRPPVVIGEDAKGNWARLQALAASGLPLPFASVDGARSLVAVDFLAAAIAWLCRDSWPAHLSGEYCIAAPTPAVLPEIVKELRIGMGLPPRLFRCPPDALVLLGALTGLRRQIASLTAPLRIDPSRFFATFEMAEPETVGESIRQSGAAYKAMRESHKMRAASL